MYVWGSSEKNVISKNDILEFVLSHQNANKSCIYIYRLIWDNRGCRRSRNPRIIHKKQAPQSDRQSSVCVPAAQWNELRVCEKSEFLEVAVSD